MAKKFNTPVVPLKVTGINFEAAIVRQHHYTSKKKPRSLASMVSAKKVYNWKYFNFHNLVDRKVYGLKES